jgi:hypothetical protein
MFSVIAIAMTSLALNMDDALEALPEFQGVLLEFRVSDNK